MRTWKVVVLCAAGLMSGLLIRTGLFYQPGQPSVTRIVMVDSNSFYSVKRAALPWYLRSGQWQADMRSLAAIWRYLTDADLAAQTNGLAAASGSV